MKFNERYPKEQVKLLETDSSQVVTKIIDHMVDVGFTGTVLEKKHCKYIPFYKDELVVITPNTEKYQVLHQNIEDITYFFLSISKKKLSRKTSVIHYLFQIALKDMDKITT